MSALMQIVTGKKAGMKFRLDGPQIRLGRHPDCEIPLDGNSVSRFHAVIYRDGDSFLIEDQNSRNGTIVNGKRVEERTLLHDSDRVKICETLLIFKVETPAEDTTGRSTAEAIPLEDDRPSTVLSTLSASGATAFNLSVKPEAKLKAILEISQAIAQTLDVESIFENILDTLFSIFPQADRAMLIQPNASGRLAPRAWKLRREDDELRFSKTVVQRALDHKEAVLSADASSDERFNMAESIADFRIRSVMCVPLIGNASEPMGVIQLDTQSYQQRFVETDLQVLLSVANQAALAMENARLHDSRLAQDRLERELHFAREVQQGFLPRESPAIEGYQFFSYYESAGQIGGDYFDFVKLPEGKWAVLVADVSGKGVPAALLMARFSSDAKVSMLMHHDNLGDAVVHLNQSLCSAGLDDRFVTMSVVLLDPSMNRAQMLCAGHMSPIVRRKSGAVEEPACDLGGSIPLGIFPHAEYRSVELALQPGDAVVIYSDGINEAMSADDEQYSTARIMKTLAVLPSDAPDLGEKLIADVREFSRGRSQHDDMTLVAFSRNASTS